MHCQNIKAIIKSILIKDDMNYIKFKFIRKLNTLIRFLIQFSNINR